VQVRDQSFQDDEAPIRRSGPPRHQAIGPCAAHRGAQHGCQPHSPQNTDRAETPSPIRANKPKPKRHASAVPPYLRATSEDASLSHPRARHCQARKRSRGVPPTEVSSCTSGRRPTTEAVCAELVRTTRRAASYKALLRQRVRGAVPPLPATQRSFLPWALFLSKVPHVSLRCDLPSRCRPPVLEPKPKSASAAVHLTQAASCKRGDRQPESLHKFPSSIQPKPGVGALPGGRSLARRRAFSALSCEPRVARSGIAANRSRRRA